MHPTLNLQQLKHAIDAVIEPGGSQMSLAEIWRTEVLKRGPQQLTTRAVAMVLAIEANGDEVDTPQSDLAGLLSSSSSTVSRHIGLLEEAGWIEKQYTAHGCTYKLVVPSEGGSATEIAQAQVVAPAQDVAQTQVSLPKKQSDMPKTQSDLHQCNPPKEKRSPKPPKKENTPPRGREADDRPTPPRPTDPMWRDRFHQFVIEMCQRYDVPVDMNDPVIITDGLEDHPTLDRGDYAAFLRSRLHDKRKYVQSLDVSEKVLQQKLRRVPGWLVENDKIDEWLSRNAAPGKQSTAASSSGTSKVDAFMANFRQSHEYRGEQ